jgi:putative ABC transport system permease protein
MVQHYLKIALRTLIKFKGFTIINITGLALGLACGILIMLYVVDELSFDNFHLKADRVYRVTTQFGEGGKNETNGWPLGNILRTEYPEVEAVLYTRNASYLMIDHQEKKIRQRIHYASPEFFTLFSFPLLKGNEAKALTEPFTLVISEEMEQKYFPNTNALGQTLRMNDTLLFTVSAVMKNIPSNSHIQVDMLASFASFQKIEPYFSYSEGWGNINMRNYILLKEGVDVAAFRQKTKNLYMERAGEMMKSWGVEASVGFEPLTSLYLSSKAGNGMGPIGSIERIYMLSGISAFIILLACINFINLATARSTYRAKEVGLRKVVGSTRHAIIKQFLGESLLITLFSFLVALALVGSMLPLFNELLAKNYSLAYLLNPIMFSGLFALILTIALLAGYYPAWVISKLKPSEIVKGKMQTSAQGVRLRRTLVAFQFCISICLTAGTLIILQQLQYMQNKDLGFQKEEVLVINAARTKSKIADGFQSFLHTLQQQAAVKHVTLCNALPGSSGWRGQIAYPEGKTGEHTVETEYMAIDENYVQTLGLTLVAGKNFDINSRADWEDGLLINEKAVIDFGWETPENAIGKLITSPSGTPQGKVIGVVKDHHGAGLQQPIGAVAMDINPDVSYLYAIRYTSADTKTLLEDLEAQWKNYFPGYEFSYFFLNKKFEQQYQTEQRLATVFIIFSFVTITIAFIGLFGLVSFIVVSKTKEIGIRKVLGANIISITKLLSYEFLMLVIIANGIAIPATWYLADNWLQNFAYRMPNNPMVFIVTATLAVVLTFVTIGIQSFRAASANPITSLRNE